MCGIVGLVNHDGRPVDRELLLRMRRCLRHRGPDAEGLLLDGRLGLGHTRLSIIDTSAAANQPLFNEDGSVAVVFNGEIYNFQELAGRLSERGHHFKTRSDTEVLVHAWEEYGRACLGQLRGMFAFAIYDQKACKLFLARDRMGKKPLFYALTSKGLAFGSEIKSVLPAPGVGRELDLVALGEYATYGNSLGARTIYRDIRKLPPGHCALVDLGRGRVTCEPEPWWQMKFEADPLPDEHEWLDRLDRTLSEAVRLRLISDVPLGAFLSGGIDSSLVVAYMAKHASRRVQTYTIGFAESAFDESRFAEPIAEYLGTEHHTEIIDPRALDLLPEIVETYDEPFGDLSAVPTYILSKMTRRQVTVALSGDGGDELFLGYERYRGAYALQMLGKLITSRGRRLAGRIGAAMPDGLFAQRSLSRLDMQDAELYDDVMGCTKERLAVLRQDVLNAFQVGRRKKLAADFNRLPGLHPLERYQYTDIMNYLPDDILVKVDRASMRHSLEVRCPLLDCEFVDLAASIPHKFKIDGGGGKAILRKLLGRHLPPRLFERPKLGFGVPFASWFRGDWKPVIDEMLADVSSPMWNYFDKRALTSWYKDQLVRLQYPQEHWWRLLLFHRWCDLKLRG